MKIDFIKIFFSWAFSALFGYVCYLINKSDIYNLIIPAIALGILTTITSIKWPKQNFSTKSVLWIGIIIQMAISISFVLWVQSIETLLVTMSLLTVSILGISYSIYKSK